MFKVFISHSNEDKAETLFIIESLKRCGLRRLGGL